MNPASTSFLLAYHGCDEQVARKVISGQSTLIPSHNDYDWLGNGIYFWEHNAQRAFEFAIQLMRRPRNVRQKIRTPAVVGAIVDLGFCLNLLDSRYLRLVREAYDGLAAKSSDVGVPLPGNSGGPDLLSRRLDCAVIRTLHEIRAAAGETPFDTVRAAFIEGDRLYDNAGFTSKNHIQICVREIRCIKGYFWPLDESGRPMRFR